MNAADIAVELSIPRPIANLFRILDARVPVALKQLIVEPPLNQLFADAIAEGEFEDLEGRIVALEVRELNGGVVLGYWQGRLRLVEGPAEVTISGDWQAFQQLARGDTDPDTLFFHRRLSISGDTELGLATKNLLDGVEWGLPWLLRRHPH